MRSVFDTNVIVSGFLWQGTPRRLLDSAIREEFTVLASESLIFELRTVLQGPKFANPLIRVNRTVETTIADYRQLAELVIALPVPFDVVRDPKDRIILECAVGGQANFIVTGDRDLLVLNAYAGIPIVTPQQFVERLFD